MTKMSEARIQSASTPLEMKGPSSAGATVRVAAAMAGWGTIGLFVVNAGSNAVTTAGWRCVFGAGTLLVIVVLNGAYRKSTITRRNVMMAVLGGVALVSNWVFLFYAFDHTTLTVATMAYHMEPFFLLLLGALFLREKVTGTHLAWIMLAFGGLALATGFVGSEGAHGIRVLAVLSALTAGLLYGIATLLAKRTVGLHVNITSLIQCGVGIVMLMPFATALEWSGGGWVWVLLMGVLHTGVLYSLLYSGVGRLSVPVIAALSFINPAVAVLCDVIFLGHVPSVMQIAGIATIVIATLGVTLNWGSRPVQPVEG